LTKYIYIYIYREYKFDQHYKDKNNKIGVSIYNNIEVYVKKTHISSESRKYYENNITDGHLYILST